MSSLKLPRTPRSFNARTHAPRPNRARRLAVFLAALCVLAASASAFFYARGRATGNTYYSRGSSPVFLPELVTSWSTTRDGLGTPPPNFTSGDTFVIQNGHGMANVAAWSISGTSSKLQIESGGTLTANAAVTLAPETTFQIDGGGTYAHNNTSAYASTIFQGTESFAPSSTVVLNNSDAVGPSGVTFGNLTINFTSDPGGDVNCDGGVTAVNGDLTVISTSAQQFSLGANTNYTLTIGGDILVQGGTLNLSSGTAIATINLGGDINQSGGTFTQTGANASTLTFTGGPSLVTFTKTGGTLDGTNINWAIAGGKTVQFNQAFTVAPSRTFDINSGGTLLAAATIHNDGAMNVNGEFRLTDGGFADGTDFVYDPNATLGFTPSGSYGVNAGHVYWPTTNGPQNVNVLTGGITMNTARTVGGLFQYSAGVSGAGNLTLNGTAQVNAGGFVSGSPTYGSSSLLKYNTGTSYGRNGEWLAVTSGAGYPANVQISGNTTLDIDNGSSFNSAPSQMSGNLTIDSGSTLTMNAMTQPLTVLGSLTDNGALTLSTQSGGDIKVGGNWTRASAATFTPNARAVFFNGSGAQTVTVTGGGTQAFDYLVLDKPSGNLTLSNVGGNLTSASVGQTAGDVLQLLNAGGVDLNGQTLTLSGSGGNLLASGGARTVTGTGTFSFTGSKTVTNASSGSLNFDTGVTVALSSGVNFGAGLSTVNGTLSIKSGGFVNTNAPAYASGSTLEYDNGTSYDAAAEFPASGVQNVSLASTTQINLNGDKSIAGTFAAGARTVGSTAATPFSLTAGNFTVSTGTLNLNDLTTTSGTSTASGAASINVAGNWDVSPFVAGASTVTFNGAGAQSINSQSTFNNLTAANDLTLNASPNVNGTLALGSHKITTAGGQALTVTATGGVTRTTGYVIGTLQKTYAGPGPASFTFDVGTANGYTPVDADSTTGTGSIFVTPTQSKQPNIAGTNALSRYWTLGATGSPTTDLTFHYLDGDVVGTESNYQVIKYSGTTASVPGGQSVNTGANTATVNGVSSFSDWTLAEPASVFGQIQFAQANTNTLEGDSGSHTVDIAVQRTGGSSGAVSVDYSVTDGTATTADNDYSVSPSTGTLNWPDGDSADKNITITVNGDTTFEPNETVNLSISNPQGGAALGSPASATLTIQNDDPEPPGSIQFSAANYDDAEGDAGTHAAAITLQRTGGAGGEVSVHWATSDGTASAGSDYDADSGDVTWPNGDSADKTFNVTVHGDTTYEANETVNLTLSGATGGATIAGTNPATLTITNDDAPPSTLVVNTTADTDDGFCLSDAGGCTLREAINAANANSDQSTIHFDIPADDPGHFYYTDDGTGSPNGHVTAAAHVNTTTASDDSTIGDIDPDYPHSWWSIKPSTPLPAITNPVLIDGYSQVGASPNTKHLDKGDDAVLRVELNGSGIDTNVTPNARGLDLEAGAEASTVSGLAVNNFAQVAVWIQSGGGATVSGNFIGTDVSGTLAQGSSGNGVELADGIGHFVGGDTPAARNVISAYHFGVDISGAETTNNSVEGNYIGTDRNAAASLGNFVGVNIQGASSGNAVGCEVLDGDNVISGNSNKGIGIDNASGNLITGNFIGTKANGTDALGNGGAGVSLYDATDNIVGFDINDFGAANTIAFNAGAGVEVETGTVAPGTGNVIRRNSVHGNGALGIDLAPNGVTGVTPNDAGDSDTGPNNLQNFPVITGATVAGATRHINGTLNSTPGQAFTIDFYANPAGSCDPSGNGEGQTYLGSATTAATDGNGDVSFTFNPPSLTPGDVITATATDAAGNTSEFSACFNAAAGSPGQIQFTDATYTVAENGASAAITFTRSGGQDGAVFATFSTSDGTANAPGDYTATTADVSYADGESGTKTINVPINDDTTYEGDETVSLSLTATTLDAPLPPASPAQSTATLTISENDAAPTLSIDDVTHNEGDAGTTSYVFTVTKSGSTALDASVNFTTVDGTATQPSDYALNNGTLTFGPGETTKTVTVLVNGETTFEADETFTVHLSNPTNATITDADGLGTITNDDAPPSFSIDDVTQNEGNSGTTSFTFTVTKTGATALASTVDFATADGTASSASDYQSNSGTLNFAANETTKTITVLVNGDTTYEADETFTVNLSNPTGATISDNQGLGTITNDDAKPTLTITPSVTLTEGNSGTKNFVFTVSKSGATDLDATVQYATADGTATGAIPRVGCGGGGDYISQSDALTFQPNETAKTITIQVCGDTSYEANETFFVNLTSPTEATITNGQGVGTINNDDKPPVTLVVNTTDDLNSGFCLAAHCSLREAIVAANSNPDTNTINFQIPADDPGHFYYADDSDAGQLSRANVTQTSASDDTTISGIDPDWPHSWWTISPQSALPQITSAVTINGYSQTGASVNTSAAGDNAVLRVEISGAGAGVGVNGPTVGGGGSTLMGLIVNRFDGHGVNLASGNNTLAGNFIGTDASGTLALANGGSGVFSSSEFSNLFGGATSDARNLLSGNTGDGISFAGGNSNTVQGNLIGTKADGVTALGNGANGVSFSAGSLFNTVGGTNAGEANTVAFNGGDGVQVGATAGVGHTVRANSIFSNGSTAAHLGIDLGADGVTPNDAQDADTGANNLQNFPVINTALVTGSTRTITGTLNSKPNQEFTIDFYSNASCDTSGNGEGKTYIGSLLTGTTDANGDVSFTFHPASLTVGQFVTATATDNVGNTSEFSACATVAGGNAGTVQFSSPTYSIAENDPAGMAHITVRRVGGSDGSISATFSTSDGTATVADNDYVAVAGQTVTFDDGDTADKTVDVTVNDDSIYEAAETVNLSLSGTTINRPLQNGPDFVASGSSATLTITNDDAPPTLSINDVTQNEGNAGTTDFTFTVTKTGATEVNATVSFATQNGSATAPGDYQSNSGTLTFLPGDATKTFIVLVNGDTTEEPDEDFTVHLSAPTGATISDADGTGTIKNDDNAPTFSVGDVTHAEGNSGTTDFTFTVTKTGATAFGTSVDVATADGTATAGSDYVAVPTTTLNFAPADTTKTVTVHVNGDTTPEVDETFDVVLSNPLGATVADGTGVGTIQNDDESVSVGQLIISEFRLRGPGASASVSDAPAQGNNPAGVGGSTRKQHASVSFAADTSPQANDEFIELYNNTDSPLLVTTTDGSKGWAVAASDGVVRFVVPAGTVIPARGHFLGVNTLGYSLSGYPAGNDGTNPTTATGDPILLADGTPAQGYTLDIPDNAGVALFRTANPSNFAGAGVRLDAAGSTSESNALYKEGAGYQALAPADIALNLEHSFYRSLCSFQQGVGCTTPGVPKDTNDNAADFLFVDTAGTPTAAGQRLGAPGPENLSSHIQRNAQVPVVPLDRSAATASAPNRVRDFDNSDAMRAPLGHLTIRRRVTNNTGAPVAQLRFRIVEVTTFPAAPGVADLRALSSGQVSVLNVGDSDTCGGPAPCTVTVQGTTVEEPPTQLSGTGGTNNGGGFNTSLSVGTITLSQPLAAGDSVNVQFLLGIKQTGTFRILVNVEAVTK